MFTLPSRRGGPPAVNNRLWRYMRRRGARGLSLPVAATLTNPIGASPPPALDVRPRTATSPFWDFLRCHLDGANSGGAPSRVEWMATTPASPPVSGLRLRDTTVIISLA